VRRGAVNGRSRPLTATLAAALCAGWLLGGCGLLGKPQPLSADAPLVMSVTSPNFKGGLIPAEFTCYGQGGGVSPPIFWSGAPPGTKSIAVVVDDAAAPISPKVYWIVFDISPSTTDLQTGALPPHARTAYNTAGTDTYDAPCPRGSAHSYRFTVYALNTFFGSALPGHPQLLPAWTAIAQHVIARGTMTSHAVPGRRPLPQLSPGHSASPTPGT
jgi:Raf kinase inhibitor-like YbhB/YbcL family protein